MPCREMGVNDHEKENGKKSGGFNGGNGLYADWDNG